MDHGVAFLCRFYGVSRAGFYAWRSRPQSARTEESRWLLNRIALVHAQSRETYGSPRVNASLRKQRIFVSKHRIARLMRENDIKGRVVRVTRRQPGLHRFCEGLPNRLKDAGCPTGPNQQWASDITYLNVQGKWRYLAVIIDLYSRRIISWALSDRRTVDLTHRIMQIAIKRRRPRPGLLFHTDRGIEYRSLTFRDLLSTHGIIASMNRPGQTTDNAYAESFFHTLKAEFFRGRCFNTTWELRQGLAGYINHFYNRQRMHSGIGYRSPEEYELLAA